MTDDDIKVANAFPSRSSQSALNIHDISSHHMTDDDIKVANALLSPSSQSVLNIHDKSYHMTSDIHKNVFARPSNAENYHQINTGTYNNAHVGHDFFRNHMPNSSHSLDTMQQNPQNVQSQANHQNYYSYSNRPISSNLPTNYFPQNNQNIRTNSSINQGFTQPPPLYVATSRNIPINSNSIPNFNQPYMQQQHVTYPNRLPNVPISSALPNINFPPNISVNVADTQHWPTINSFDNPYNVQFPTSSSNIYHFNQMRDTLPPISGQGNTQFKNVPRSLTFNGTTSWITFKQKLIYFFNKNAISDLNSIKYYLTMILEGSAADYFSFLDSTTTFENLTHILNLLEQRFDDRDLAESALVHFQTMYQKKGEDIKMWGERCRKIAHEAFPNLSAVEIERQVIIRFCLALQDKSAAMHLSMINHSTLASAMKSYRVYLYAKNATNNLTLSNNSDPDSDLKTLHLENNSNIDSPDSIRVVSDRQMRDLNMRNNNNKSELDYLANWLKKVSDKVDKLLSNNPQDEGFQSKTPNKQDNIYQKREYNSRNASPTQSPNNSDTRKIQFKSYPNRASSYDHDRSYGMQRSQQQQGYRYRSPSPYYNNNDSRSRSLDRTNNYRRRFDSPRPNFRNNNNDKPFFDNKEVRESSNIRQLHDDSDENLAKVTDPKA